MSTTLVRCFEDTRGKGVCRACAAVLTWLTTIAGKKMPFDGDPVALKTEHDDSHRLVGFYDIDAVHWRTCEPERLRR